MQSNVVEKKVFHCAFETNNYYWLIQTFMPIELVFLLLAQLSPLIGPPTDLNCTKSKNLSDNYSKKNANMSNEVSGEKLVPKLKELMTEEKLITEEELVIEEKLKTKGEIKIGNLKDFE